MKKRNPNRINELRLRRQWNQNELAEKVGAHWVTISKLERGQMQLTHEWMVRLADALGVSPAELISDHPTTRTLYVSGWINKDGFVNPEFFEKPVDDSLGAVPFDVEIGAEEPDRTVWYFVISDALRPFFKSGDLIRFTYQTVLNTDAAFGRLCLIETNETVSRKIMGIPSRGSARELVDIQIVGGAPLQDVPVADIATASMAIFDPNFRLQDDGYPEP